MLSRKASMGVRLGLFVVAVASVTALARGGAGWSTPALAGGTIPQVCPIYQSNDVPKAIPDDDVTGVASTLSIVAPGLRITNVSVRLNLITHPYVGDLRLRLLAPDQTSITLIGDPGVAAFDGDNFVGTTLDDQFTTSILNGAPPFTGGFRPVSPLAPLRGKPLAGVWQLVVADVTAQDTGQLDAWSLEVCSLPDRIWLPIVLR